MYKIKRFSYLKVPNISEEQYYDIMNHNVLDPLDSIANKIGDTGIVSIDKKSRNIKAITGPLKKWNKYKIDKAMKNKNGSHK